MKKIVTILSFAALLMATLACEKNLDIRQKSVLSTEGFYENATPEDAEALIGSIYHLYWGGRDVTCVNGIEKIMFLNAIDDDHYPGGGSFTDNSNQFQDAGNYNVTSADSAPKIMYRGVYKVIYHCNLILEKIPESNDERINRVRAEANFLRALAMFDAVRWWGTPPLVDHVLSQDEYYQSNTPTEESIKWILDRMKEAADALPAISGKGQQEAFGARISKHAALAYRGKVGLWYGQKFNDKTILEGAVKDLQTVINSGLYGLVSDMFIIERQAGDFCEEYVFEHNAGDNDGFPGDPSNDLRHTWTGWPSTIQLPSDFFGGWGWNAVSKEFGEFLAKHEGGTEKPRFKSTIHTYDQVLAMDYAEGVTPGVTAESGVYHNAGYFTFRGLGWLSEAYEGTSPPFWKWYKANTPMLRYAEVLLLYAEAKFLYDNDADGTGLKALNEVRRRAQIPELASMTYQDIKDERRAELFCEQERYFDLVRWGEASTVLANKGKTYYKFHGYKPGTTEWDVEAVPGDGKGWQDKYELLPFPYEQTSANPNLKQNPGW
ncbi:MAG: RagB/SusD family nutrient uptake outer membrane protein [Bacteroidales bacterium]|nr:RagB/SusD family nutrient uptake outer membrane protein [Bacteroidales bacterium]MBR2228035.1 RagB/SusD family nutrient uptake outer membrane protein [Bacteroidales bacterium]MBR3097205.1 RagB/SusD family nutrient uptake outer membrane protein [Bacteroidales bacterium]